MYRINENQVMRAGYGQTINPLPWSRPMRGSFPFDISYNNTADQLPVAGHAGAGHPGRADSRHQLGTCEAAAGRLHPVAESERGQSRHDPAVERRLRIPAAVRHRDRVRRTSAPRTDGGYADLNINYGTPGGGNAVAPVLRARRQHRDQRLGARAPRAATTACRSPSTGRSARASLLKGAYTLSKSKNMADEDGWVGLDLQQPAGLRPELRDGRLRPYPRVPDGLRLLAAVPAGIARAWLARFSAAGS